MPEKDDASGGSGGDPSGNTNDKPKKDSVAYDTHMKLLDEKKIAQS